MNQLNTIFDETFQNPGIPANFYTDTVVPKYPGGMWDCRPGDGVFANFPHDAWETLRVEVDLADLGPNANAFVGTDSRTALSVWLGQDPAGRHGASDGGYVIELSKTKPPIENGAVSLVFEWTSEKMRVLAGDVELLNVPNLRKSAKAGSLQMGFRDCTVRRLAAFGQEMAEIPAPIEAIQSDYPLEVTVDFNDDLMPCAWTHKTFDNLFKELKSWGTKRVSWIDLGRKEDDYFRYAPYGIDVTGLQTFENVGDIFKAAVDHAHKEGIELYGVLKPFDMAIAGFTWPKDSPTGREKGRIERIGGVLGWATLMVTNNQHLLMARKPGNFGPAKNEVWTRLDLVKEDDESAAISPDDIEFLVSDDNGAYFPYEGPITRSEVVEDYPVYKSTPSGPKPTGETRRARVFRFENLDLRSDFFAIKVTGTARSFTNRFCDLVHLFGPNGEETHVTHALSPRKASHVSLFEAGANTVPKGPGASADAGFEFNRFPGSPSSATSSGGEPMNGFLSLDRGAASYIAFGRGKDRCTLALMSPNFPETRKLWMTWVKAMLDAGADGIDIRTGHHHSDFSWIDLGFEEPVRDEMLKRTGVDIWETDDFDYEEWRKIRGEGYSQFMREASDLVRSRGKKIVAHVDGYFDNAPGLGAAMNMVTDWRSWLTEKVLDGVTGKALWPGASYSREVVGLAHANGIPVTFVPYCNNFFEDRNSMNHLGASPVGCEVPVSRLVEWGRKNGYDRFGFYECASALWAAKDETVDFRPNAHPTREMFQRHFLDEAHS